MSYNNDSEQTRKLFIGGLSGDTTDDSLKQYFEQYGTITDCVVIKDKETHVSKKFGFVTFETEAEVDAAQAARPHSIDNKTVDTKRAMAKPAPGGGGRGGGVNRTNKCYIGGLKDQCDEESVKQHFSTFGEIENAHFPKDKETGKAKPFAFITFVDFDIADKCVLHEYHSINGVSVTCKKANENKDGGRGGRGGGFGGGRGRGRGGGYGRGGGSGYGGGYGQQQYGGGYSGYDNSYGGQQGWGDTSSFGSNYGQGYGGGPMKGGRGGGGGYNSYGY